MGFSLFLSLLLYDSVPDLSFREFLSLYMFRLFLKDFFSILVQNLWDSICIILALASEPAIFRVLFPSWRVALDSECLRLLCKWRWYHCLYVCLCSVGDQTQDFVHAREAFCHQAPSPVLVPLPIDLFWGLEFLLESARWLGRERHLPYSLTTYPW